MGHAYFVTQNSSLLDPDSVGSVDPDSVVSLVLPWPPTLCFFMGQWRIILSCWLGGAGDGQPVGGIRQGDPEGGGGQGLHWGGRSPLLRQGETGRLERQVDKERQVSTEVDARLSFDKERQVA